jgi:hypothetical protein
MLVKLVLLQLLTLNIVFSDDPNRLPTKCESKMFLFVDHPDDALLILLHVHIKKAILIEMYHKKKETVH